VLEMLDHALLRDHMLVEELGDRMMILQAIHQLSQEQEERKAKEKEKATSSTANLTSSTATTPASSSSSVALPAVKTAPSVSVVPEESFAQQAVSLPLFDHDIIPMTDNSGSNSGSSNAGSTGGIPMTSPAKRTSTGHKAGEAMQDDIEYKDLRLIAELGRGASSIVYSAMWCGTVQQ
jgi:hypothetical protein